MNRILLIALLLVLTTTACSKEEVGVKSRKYENFTQIRSEMKYEAIVEKFGEPDQDLGSGIHIYVYILADNTEIWIGYTDAILYARHMDSQRNLLHVII
jgi:hypothetical protein